MRKGLAIGVAALLLACLTRPAFAQVKESDEDLRAAVEALKQRIKDQDRRISELEQASTQPTSASDKEATKQAIREVLKEMKIDADQRCAQPAWMNNFKLYGDLRLRYAMDDFNFGTSANGDDKKTRNRARFRLRFGATKTWLEDQLEVGFRLASGSDDDPTTTNQTFTGQFDKKLVWIDLAYAKYSPKDLKGFMIEGGKMIKPWVENDIFWSTNVDPEGFWAEYTLPKSNDCCLQPFVGAGYFIVNESSDGPDSTMYIAQGGTKIYFAKDVWYTFAFNFQSWDAFDDSGIPKPRGNDSPLSTIGGMHVLDFSNQLDFPLCGRPMNLLFDYAKNPDASDPNDPYEGQNKAWCVGAKYGQNKKKGDWSVRYRYAFVEANAIPGYFMDPDFGFANRKGHVVGADYNLLDDVTVGVSVYLTEPIFSPTTTANNPYEDKTTTVFFDLVWKF